MNESYDRPYFATGYHFVSVTVLAMLAGCGSPYGATVSGNVTLNGSPLDHGTVMFYPVAQGTPAYGTIETDGSYRIKTGREAGLPPGDYIVTVASRERLSSSRNVAAHHLREN